MTGRGWPLAIAALGWMIALASPARCCDTPVYRYAMYRWQPAPYEVYFFHNHPPSPPDRLVAERLSKAARSDDAANVVHIPVDLSRDPELLGVPQDVRQAWDEREDKSLPFYLVATPHGRHLHAGSLDPAALPGLLQSPVRKQLGRQLEAGKLGVLIFVPGADPTENERVANLLEELQQQLADGMIVLRPDAQAGPPAGPGAGVVPGVPRVDEAKPEIAVVQVDRDDPAETWFLRILLATETELADEQRPLVFVAYGRARVLLPYIGAGITYDNLIRELQFISGACSCTVKEQNPGVDLLLQYDWEAAAAALAERFGVEEGNEQQFGPGGFFPELIIPSATTAPSTGSPSSTGDSSAGANSENAEPATQDATTDDQPAPGDVVIHGRFDKPAPAEANGEPSTLPAAAVTGHDASPAGDGALTAADGAVPSDSDPPANVPPSVPDDTQEAATSGNQTSPVLGTEVASLPSEQGEDGAAAFEGSSLRSIFIIGGGLAIAFIMLVGVTFVVMRPR